MPQGEWLLFWELSHVLADSANSTGADVRNLRTHKRGFLDEVLKSQKVKPHVTPQDSVAGMCARLPSYSSQQVAAAVNQLSQLVSRLGTKPVDQLSLNGVTEMTSAEWLESQGIDATNLSEKQRCEYDVIETYELRRRSCLAAGYSKLLVRPDQSQT